VMAKFYNRGKDCYYAMPEKMQLVRQIAINRH